MIKLFRFNEWKGNNLAILMTYFYMFHIIKNSSFNEFIAQLPFVIIIIISIGFLGYYFNDICDVELDTKVGKTNFAATHSPTKRYIILVILSLLPFVIWYYLSHNFYVLYVILFEYLLIFTYSSHLVRFKERPILSILNDSIAAQVNFTIIIILSIFQNLSEINLLYFLLFISWVFIMGMKYITGHHLKDFFNDKKTNTKTSATVYGYDRVIKINKIILPILEIVIFSYLLIITHTYLAIIYLIYILGVLSFIKIDDYLEMSYNPMKDLAYRLLNLFYIRILPLATLIILSFTNYYFLFILALHLLFFNENTRYLLNDLRLSHFFTTKIPLLFNYLIYYLFRALGINLKSVDQNLSLAEKLLQIHLNKSRKPYGYDLPNWAKEIEDNIENIIKEWEQYVLINGFGKSIDSISKEQSHLNVDKKWKSALLYSYTYYNNSNLEYFPNLRKIIKKYQDKINLVMFSTAEAGKVIPTHKGNNYSVLRMQVGIDIKEAENCYLRVEDKRINLKERDIFIFDDTFEHELVNESSTHRTVLIIDYFKPLPRFYRWLNKKKIENMKKTDYVQSVVQKFN